MELNDMILLSIDDHVIEPPDVFERHMPLKYKADAPRLVKGDDGVDKWVFQGETTGVAGLSAVVSWPSEEWGFDPVGFAEMRPGAYDVHERVKDMDANGNLAGMNFPTFAGFAGAHLAKAPDRKLSAMAVAAYNDWHIDDWCGAYPGRFMPMGILPIFDIDAAVAEVHRIAAKGAIAVTLPETPYGIGLPDFGSGHWDPVFAALCDHDMVPCMHIGGAFGLLQRPPQSKIDDLIMLAPQLMAVTATDLMIGGVFRRFPNLRVALSEGGIGWISFFLDRFDRHVTNQSWTHLDQLPPGKTPTEAFRDHFLACFITDPSALRVRDRVGVQSLAWECDYPHSDCTWPRSPEKLYGELVAAGCTDDEIDAITWKNVACFFNYDPFVHIQKEHATVAALRKRALNAGVDTHTTSRSEYRRRYEARLATV